MTKVHKLKKLTKIKVMIRPNFFLYLLTNPHTVLFRKVEKNISFSLFYPPTLCLIEKNNIFLRICMCIFESDTVKSDCPIQTFRKMMKYINTSLVLLFFSGDIKKSSVNE